MWTSSVGTRFFIQPFDNGYVALDPQCRSICIPWECYIGICRVGHCHACREFFFLEEELAQLRASRPTRHRCKRIARIEKIEAEQVDIAQQVKHCIPSSVDKVPYEEYDQICKESFRAFVEKQQQQ